MFHRDIQRQQTSSNRKGTGGEIDKADFYCKKRDFLTVLSSNFASTGNVFFEPGIFRAGYGVSCRPKTFR